MKHVRPLLCALLLSLGCASSAQRASAPAIAPHVQTPDPSMQAPLPPVPPRRHVRRVRPEQRRVRVSGSVEALSKASDRARGSQTWLEATRDALLDRLRALDAPVVRVVGSRKRRAVVAVPWRNGCEWLDRRDTRSVFPRRSWDSLCGRDGSDMRQNGEDDGVWEAPLRRWLWEARVQTTTTESRGTNRLVHSSPEGLEALERSGVGLPQDPGML